MGKDISSNYSHNFGGATNHIHVHVTSFSEHVKSHTNRTDIEIKCSSSKCLEKMELP